MASHTPPITILTPAAIIYGMINHFNLVMSRLVNIATRISKHDLFLINLHSYIEFVAHPPSSFQLMVVQRIN